MSELTAADKRALLSRLMVTTAGCRDAHVIPTWPSAPCLVELARLHAGFLGTPRSQTMFALWLGLPGQAAYRKHLDRATPALIEIARNVLLTETVEEFNAIRNEAHRPWSNWLRACETAPKGGGVGRPLTISASAIGANSIAMEELRVKAGFSGAAWAALLGVSYTKYVQALETMDITEENLVAARAFEFAPKTEVQHIDGTNLTVVIEPVTTAELHSAYEEEWLVYAASVDRVGADSPVIAAVESDPLTETATSEEVDVG